MLSGNEAAEKRVFFPSLSFLQGKSVDLCHFLGISPFANYSHCIDCLNFKSDRLLALCNIAKLKMKEVKKKRFHLHLIDRLIRKSDVVEFYSVLMLSITGQNDSTMTYQ